MELTDTHVRYLLAIRRLAESENEVSSRDISRLLGVKKASVSRMTSVLMEKNLLVKRRYGKVYLTGDGYLLTNRVARQVDQLSTLIRGPMGLSGPEAWTAACAAVCALPESKNQLPGLRLAAGEGATGGEVWDEAT